jgi:very-short-patch-repair endonuclease
MLKDWDYWKRKYLSDQEAFAKNWFKRIEKQTQSPIESIVCLYLRTFANENFDPLELEVLTQMKLGPYIVDFLVIYEKLNLKIVVECDGHDFHEKTKKQAAHDKKRDRFLTKNGFILLRYTGSQICENPHEVIDDISDLIVQRKNDTAS